MPTAKPASGHRLPSAEPVAAAESPMFGESDSRRGLMRADCVIPETRRGYKTACP